MVSTQGVFLIFHFTIFVRVKMPSKLKIFLKYFFVEVVIYQKRFSKIVQLLFKIFLCTIVYYKYSNRFKYKKPCSLKINKYQRSSII